MNDTERRPGGSEPDPYDVTRLLDACAAGDGSAFEQLMTVEETAEALGISTSTVDRDWVRARTYLYRDLSDETEAGENESAE